MANRSKVYIPPVTSTRCAAPGFSFVFSDDIEKWMYSSEGNARQRKHEEKKRTGGRIDKNSWG